MVFQIIAFVLLGLVGAGHGRRVRGMVDSAEPQAREASSLKALTNIIHSLNPSGSYVTPEIGIRRHGSRAPSSNIVKMLSSKDSQRRGPEDALVTQAGFDLEKQLNSVTDMDKVALDAQNTTDTLKDLMSNLPHSLYESFQGRDHLAMIFLIHGAIVCAFNIAGMYTEHYNLFAVAVAVVLGFTSATWGAIELATGQIAHDNRPGFTRERVIVSYTNTYLAAVSWLALRLSPLYPMVLTPLDPLLSLASIVTYGYGIVAPLHTAFQHWDELTESEQTRMKGMIVSGVIGGGFILESSALFFNGGQSWWERVVELYPSQTLLEPSVTLFAAYAAEAAMLLHRFTNRGLITDAQAVPFYAFGIVPFLTVFPVTSVFFWKQEEISLWLFLFL